MRVTAVAFAVLATTLASAHSDEASHGVDEYNPIGMRDMVKLDGVHKRSEGEDPVTLWVHKSFKVRSEDEATAGVFPQLNVREDKKNNGTTVLGKVAAALRPKKSFKVKVTDDWNSIVKWVEKKDKKKEDHKKPKTAEEKKQAKEKIKEKCKAKFDGGSCGASTFTNKTSIESPITEACLAIGKWARKHPGHWVFQPAKVQGEINLIVAVAKNAGGEQHANCRFIVKNSNGDKTFIANVDVADLITDSHRRFRVKYDKRYRMAAEGNMKCDKQFKNGTKVQQQVNWGILRYDGGN